MADPIFVGVFAALFQFGITDWISNNPIIAAILVGLLALFFFLYLLLRRTIVEFKDGMRSSDRK